MAHVYQEANGIKVVIQLIIFSVPVWFYFQWEIPERLCSL